MAPTVSGYHANATEKPLHADTAAGARRVYESLDELAADLVLS